MKPRIIFGLIFGILGIPLDYTLNAIGGECWWFVVIGITAGSAGLLTSLTEKAQNSGEASKAGATTGAIIGILLGLSMGAHFYSPNGTFSDFFLVIFDIIVLSIFAGAITVVVSVVAAITATPIVRQSIAERVKKHKLVLIAGVFAAVFTYFAIPETVSLLSQYGIFNSWSTIKSPPSGTARILGVTDAAFKEYDDVVIESQDGQIFSASVCTGYSQPCGDSPQWKPVSTTPEYYVQYTSGTDCKKLGNYPINPSGQIVECRYYVFWENDLSTVIYYVLMTGGSLKYFVTDWVVQFSLLFKFFLITVLIYFVMLLLIFRATRYVAEHSIAKRKNSSSQTPIG